MGSVQKEERWYQTQIPTFFHITPARVHDTKAMDIIPYEENSFYIFDRGYNDFKPMKWKRRFLLNQVSCQTQSATWPVN